MFMKKMMAAATALVTGFAAFTGSVAAEDWPIKPITVIVTYAAGGNADLQTRIEAKYLEPILGQPIKVVNVPGGGHIPGVVKFLKEPADGYTWLRFASPSTVIGPLVRNTPFDPVEDFIPAWMATQGSTVLYVPKDSPIQTFDDFLAAAKEKDLVMGVNNIGAPPHLSAVALTQSFDTQFKILAMKTHGSALNAMIGGNVDVVIALTTHGKQFSDDVRAIAILDERKDFFEAHLPGVPTLPEVYPDVQVGNWIKSGLTAKQGIDPAIINKLVDATRQVFENPDFQEEYAVVNTLVPVYGTEEVMADIKKGIAFYTPILSELGLLKSK